MPTEDQRIREAILKFAEPTDISKLPNHYVLLDAESNRIIEQSSQPYDLIKRTGCSWHTLEDVDNKLANGIAFVIIKHRYVIINLKHPNINYFASLLAIPREV